VKRNELALIVNKDGFLSSLSRLKAFYTMLLETYQDAELEHFEEEYKDEIKIQIELIGLIIHGFDNSLDSTFSLKKTNTLN